MASARLRQALRLDPLRLSRLSMLKGLLRGELAVSAGLSPASISHCFAGRAVGVRVARKVAKALGTTIEDIAADETDDAAAAQPPAALAS